MSNHSENNTSSDSQALRVVRYPGHTTWFATDTSNAISPFLLPSGPILIDFAVSIPPDLSDFSDMRPDLERYKSKPATNPPTQTLYLEFKERLFDFRFLIYSQSFVSVFDVVQRAHTVLHLPFFRLPGPLSDRDQKSIYASHFNRLKAITDPHARNLQLEAGLKNIDRLLGAHHFLGVHWEPTVKERCTLRMFFYNSSPSDGIVDEDDGYQAERFFNAMYR